MEEINAVSRVRHRTRKGSFDKPDIGIEQRHENEKGTEHYHTSLFVGQTRLGFVSIEIEAKAGLRKSALGYFTLNPTEAKALADSLNQFANEAQKDKDNLEFNVQELPDSPLA
jgi:hypothetical protein